MKKQKKLLALLVAGTMCLSFAGCTSTKDTGSSAVETSSDGTVLDTATKTLRQNDYRGGIMRTNALKDSVLAVMENMKANNTVVRTSSPNSFWTVDGYQDFVSTFLDIAIITDTQWFNEEQTKWANVLTQMSTTANSFTMANSEGYALQSGITITRNEKDDYSISNVPATYSSNITGANIIKGLANYRVLFDCDKDWCKAYATLPVSDSSDLEPITSQLFEYQRIDDNTFAIQTSRERLVVILKPAEADTDIRDREVKEFYYSKLVLDGIRTTYKPYEELPEKSTTGIILNENIRTNALMASYPQLNRTGDLASQYGEKDSMFYADISKDKVTDWVFEDNSLQQGIVYKDGVLVATTYNKLSGNYERFIYALTDAKGNVDELEKIVAIDELVGVNSTSVITDEENKEDSEETTTEPTTTKEAPAEETSETTQTTVTEKATVTTVG